MPVHWWPEPMDIDWTGFDDSPSPSRPGVQEVIARVRHDRRLTPYPHEARFSARTPSPLASPPPSSSLKLPSTLSAGLPGAGVTQSAPTPRTARPFFARDIRTPRASVHLEKGPMLSDIVMTRMDNISVQNEDCSLPIAMDLSFDGQSECMGAYTAPMKASSFPPTRLRKNSGSGRPRPPEINVPPLSPLDHGELVRSPVGQMRRDSEPSVPLPRTPLPLPVTPIPGDYSHKYGLSIMDRQEALVPRRSPAVDSNQLRTFQALLSPRLHLEAGVDTGSQSRSPSRTNRSAEHGRQQLKRTESDQDQG